MEIVSRDEVLEVVKRNGPMIPRAIVKELGKSDTFMVGAVLSELTSAKKVKVTNTKIGASPAYYVEGQELALQDLSKHLNEKDRRAFDELQKNKILRDSKQTPLMRVSLREIKDFSRPIEVTINGQKEIFWKYYTISNEEAINMIKLLFAKPKPLDVSKPVIEEIKVASTEPKLVEPVKEQKTEIENEKEFKFKPAQEIHKKEEQSKITTDSDLENTEFLTQIRSFFEQNNIIIEKEEQIKKNSEYDFLIKLPSAFGRLNFFCKAKSKKKNNEQDVAAAYLAADQYRLPTIFLTNGEFTKKAELELEKFKSITIRKI